MKKNKPKKMEIDCYQCEDQSKCCRFGAWIDLEEAKKILSDPKRTEFNLVLIPEAMSILESERALHTLKEYGISVNNIIVNQMVPENPSCKFCSERRSHQQERLKEIQQKFNGVKIKKLEAFKEEVNGVDALKKVAGILYIKS